MIGELVLDVYNLCFSFVKAARTALPLILLKGPDILKTKRYKKIFLLIFQLLVRICFVSKLNFNQWQTFVHLWSSYSPPTLPSSSLESKSNVSELKNQMREMSNLSASSTTSSSHQYNRSNSFTGSSLRSGSGSGPGLLRKQDSAAYR